MERKLYLDQAKGIGIMMIILQHISNFETPFLVFGNSFKIVIFFIISGYLFQLQFKNNITYKDFIIKKIKTLGIPYLFFSTLFIIINIFLMFIKKENNLSNILILIYDVVSLKGLITLWFLPTIFLVEIIYFFINLHRKKYINTISIIISFLLIIIIGYTKINIWELFGNSLISKAISCPIGVIIKATIALGFFSFSAAYTEKILDYSKKHFIIFLITSIILCQLNYGIDFNNMIFGKNPILFIICGILASYGIIGILKNLNIKKKYMLNFLGNNSLFIMYTHLLYITQIIVKIISVILSKFNTKINCSIETLICFILIMFIEYLILKIWKFIKKQYIHNTRFEKVFKYI